tara:strand:- start:847 stop:1581 length:735 start_codon:yes stop_codon:yes gene_type:complete
MNLVFQYYMPYEANDAHLGGVEMPSWAKAGSKSAKQYAEQCDAEYRLDHDRYFKHLDPRLDALKVIYDPQYDKYDKILSVDLDMLFKTTENIFDIPIGDVAMVHEVGIHVSAGGWMKRIMESPGHERGIIAYGKKLFGADWMFPKSKLYPDEKFRYMNGGMQLWSKEGRLKARDLFTSVDHYYMHTRYTEQMYLNLQLSNPTFEVTELDWTWNSLATRQWPPENPQGKIQHFINASKFKMPELV